MNTYHTSMLRKVLKVLWAMVSTLSTYGGRKVKKNSISDIPINIIDLRTIVYTIYIILLFYLAHLLHVHSLFGRRSYAFEARKHKLVLIKGTRDIFITQDVRCNQKNSTT